LLKQGRRFNERSLWSILHPIAEGKWPGYSKRFLSAVDAAMTVKPDERPQTLSDWLATFGKPSASTDDGDDEATRFFAKQVETPEIVPVPPTPDADSKAKVETAVPASPKEASFKRAGQETTGSKKYASEEQAAEAKKEPAEKAAVAASAISPAESKPPSKRAAPVPAAAPKKKPNMVVLGGAAAAVLAVVAVGAITLRGGSKTEPQATVQTNAINSLGPAPGAATTEAGTQEGAVADNGALNETAADTTQAAAAQSNTAQALAAEKAKTAAMQAQLAAAKKAAAKAGAVPAMPGAPVAAKKGAKTAAATETAAASDSGASAGTVSQINSTIDDARSMAKQVMRNGSGQNVQLARNYDSYLRTLKDSVRGVQSEREAQKLLKQASQTRQYIVFLQKQSQ
jgi:hypothetical protein